MFDETPIEYEIVHKFESEAERDQFALSMQWPEDKTKYKKLITPTNLNEVLL